MAVKHTNEASLWYARKLETFECTNRCWVSHFHVALSHHFFDGGDPCVSNHWSFTLVRVPYSSRTIFSFQFSFSIFLLLSVAILAGRRQTHRRTGMRGVAVSSPANSSSNLAIERWPVYTLFLILHDLGPRSVDKIFGCAPSRVQEKEALSASSMVVE